MILFADASAIVKVYADEPGSDLARAPDTFVVSALSRVEVVAAIWRKQRTSDLSPAYARMLVDEFLADWSDGGEAPRYIPIRATTDVLDRAVMLSGVHALRAYDAVQLASAIAVREADNTVTSFLAFDAELTRAAAVEGFSVITAEP